MEQHHALTWEPVGNLVRSLVHSRDDIGWIVIGGRVVLAWLPIYALLAKALPPLAAATTASMVTGIWLLALRAALGTYFTLGPTVASAAGTVTGLVAVSALDLWVPGIDFGVPALAGTAIAVFILSATWEHVVRSLIKHRVLVIGTDGDASEVMQELQRDVHAPFSIVGVVGERPPAGAAEIAGRGALDELRRVVEAQRPDIVILTDDRASAWAVEPLLDLAPMGFKVVGVSHFFEHAIGRVPLRHLTPAWFMSILHLRQKPYTRLAKRSFDLVVASLGLLLIAPLLPMLAAVVRMSRGPIIYSQIRLGEGGRHYRMYKFRTMRADAEEAGRPLFASESDPRVTRLGRLLRQTHLDEVPQLWNVVKGEMSIVGPRPERPEFVEMLEDTVPFWTRRLLVKPGITGWAQLRCGYAYDAESAAEKLSYDLWYLRHRNVVIDLAICAKTVSTLLFKPGR
ncbi:MAG: exopolysaccharide biosynthesis polyprenyl glycosylphosphotransferase [Actinobacteria bacterium]|nr:MAG: exopolysaccharide biosynthesis polyprenyl glycosylphosphotransferase [Actinomycetota bacterium]